MKQNQICSIVQDLLPNYIEDLFAQDTKDFIEEHLNTCSECKKLYESMKSDISDKEKQITVENKTEVNHFKKYKNRMFILKSFICVLLIFIISSCTIFTIKFKNNTNIIDIVYHNIKNLDNIDNLKISVSKHKIDYTSNNDYLDSTSIYFYNDLYMSKISNYYGQLENIKSISYGNFNTNSSFIFLLDNNSVVNFSTFYKYISKDEYITDTFSTFMSLFDMNYSVVYTSDFMVKTGMTIKSERYNGKDCYVLKFDYSSTNYSEIWIDKSTMLPIREIQDMNGSQYIENIITIELGTVTDKDVTIPDDLKAAAESFNLKGGENID